MSVVKPCSSGSTASPTADRGNAVERVAVGDAAQIGDAALAQHGGEPVGRALAEGGDRGLAAGFALGFEIVAHRLEQLDLGIGALGGEIAHRPRAGIELVDCGVGAWRKARSARPAAPAARSAIRARRDRAGRVAAADRPGRRRARLRVTLCRAA